jgi:hypothetical protein
MSQPTQEKLPPAYLVHRGLLVAVVVLAAALVFAYLLGPVIVDVVQWLLSRIQAVREA